MSVSNTTLQLTDSIQLRGGTAEALATENPIPKAREIMVETDTGKAKVGNGTSSWNDLLFTNHDDTDKKSQ